ncbi:lactonase family protein [Candidatus Clostridium stratigraminis]|uniref:Lactonase family protein n=1 Tax=Candidatus Clostridium stratigraminis TaxID=3381661 RepID=A0ABW8T6W2_9CLOT
MSIKNNRVKAFIGTYTTGEGKGIYSLQLDLITGAIDSVRLEAELGNPTYLSIDKNNSYLYSTIKKGESGGVAAFSINSDTRSLKLLNYKVSEGSSPCHVSLNSNSTYLFSANYHRGIEEVYPIKRDGTVEKAVSTAVHSGSGPDGERQKKPHVHFSALTPDEKYLCSVDLGIDKLIIYTLESGILSKHKEIALKPGCGPRHIDFHPNGKFAYIITELSSEVIVLKYDSLKGDFEELQYISALPSGFNGESLGSAIHISLDGKYLYSSNRGHDSIAVFKIDSLTGKLTLVSHTSTDGKHPRDFNIDPMGKFLIAANRDTNNIVPFLIDKLSGKLTQVNSGVSIPNPVCIKFLAI